MSKLRAKDYPNIVKKYQSGISQVEIGKDYGVSSQYIGRILKKYKVPGRVGGYSSPKLEVRANHRRILGLFQDGYTITQVAKQTGYTAGGVYYVLKKAGLVKPSGDRRRRGA
jgi:DNA invertase Pin-like site-specific DNA recombinase